MSYKGNQMVLYEKTYKVESIFRWFDEDRVKSK
jgi:hypothetical protein